MGVAWADLNKDKFPEKRDWRAEYEVEPVQLVRHHQPLMRNFVTDAFALSNTQQGSNKCPDFELRLVECYEAYGRTKGNTLCRDFYDDLYECTFKEKQMNRLAAMDEQRQRLVAAGEITKEEMYPLKRSRRDGYCHRNYGI